MIRIPWLSAIAWVIATAGPLTAECVANNRGGIRINPIRPTDADVPAASFSPLNRLNSSLPRWLCLSAGYRTRAEGFSGGNFLPNNADSYLLTQFRLGALMKPSSWLHVYAELQDAAAFRKNPPVGPPHQTTWDLRRAFVDFGDIERGTAGFRVGRQDLTFGDGRLVGTSSWRNASRGYDAAMMVLRWRQFRASAFAGSQVVVRHNGLSHHQQGNNIHGIYGSAANLIPGTDLEPYFFWRLAPGAKTEGGAPAKLDQKTIGIRAAGAVSGWDYVAEVAGQVGAAGADSIRAWAGAASTGYTFRTLRLRPRLFVEYDFASGDRNPTDGARGTFDQLLPRIHGYNGLADQIAWQNLKQVRTGVRISLRRNWTLSASFNDWWLASATDAFYNSAGGVVARDPKGLSGTHIGEEYDLETSYRINRELEVGAGIGRVLPGGFLVRTNHNHAYTYPYVQLNYNFF